MYSGTSLAFAKNNIELMRIVTEGTQLTVKLQVNFAVKDVASVQLWKFLKEIVRIFCERSELRNSLECHCIWT
jgi:hypothetical protein